MVDDPGFWAHSGADWTTPGSGLTTLTQSLGKHVGFVHFRPGLQKIRLVGYAMGLESELTKQQILALYLDTVWMGRGPSGPMVGMFNASEKVFGKPPSELNQHQFLTLVAVPISPRTLTLASPNSDLIERTIELSAWSEGNAGPSGFEMYGSKPARNRNNCAFPPIADIRRERPLSTHCRHQVRQ
jgi:membrane carboxypeptidase/penicillin-binding protein PbpC